MDFSEKTHKNVDKVARYNWTISDKPGKLQWINKELLNIDDAYQRSLISQRVTTLSQEWSWIACGVLVVAFRDECYWVVDGQHRLMAAKRRSDIQSMPCVVFEISNVKQEAKGFVSVNCSRKPVSVRQRHKAMVISGDEIASMVQDQIEELGLSTTADSKAPGYFACFAWAINTAEDDYDTFCAVLKVAAEIAIKDSEPIKNTILQGLTYIHKNHTGGIREPRIADRIKFKGAVSLDVAARKAAAMLGHGGSKIWAKGILDELNKGLQKKFYVKGFGDS